MSEQTPLRVVDVADASSQRLQRHRHKRAERVGSIEYVQPSLVGATAKWHCTDLLFPNLHLAQPKPNDQIGTPFKIT